ncbi:unnamed protein product [Musa hybrid cultivar]
MNPREHIGKAFDASSSANGGNPSLKSKGVEESSSTKGDHKADQMSMDMADVSIASQEEGWEVYGKKSKKRAGSSGRGTITTASGPKPWGSSPNAPRSWGQSDGLPRQRWGANGGTARTSGSNWAQANASHRPASKVNPKQQPTSKGLETQHMALPPVIPSQLQHGWNWAARGDFSGSQPKSDEFISNHLPQNDSSGGCDSDSNAMAQKSGDVLDDDDDDDDDLVEDSDDNFSDGYDSDASQKTHKTRKKSKPFRGFFEDLDKLTNEEINEQMRQWHCPACRNGPGEIVWYKGLQPLLTHANKKRAARVKLHQELALLLEEELRHRGTSPVPAGEVFGKWKGLQETTTDREIVWPPMVVIMNTLLEQDENEMWIGMGRKEFVEYFSSYAAVKACHSYGPRGHRGMSVLIFEPTAVGYLEAEQLHNHFAEQGKDRDAWEHRRILFSAGGKRQLYGYLANKEDVDVFNHHSHGKHRLKFEMRSYEEMVVIPMKQMNEDNQQLIWLKNKVVKQEQQSKVLKETIGVVTQRWRETVEENIIVRRRSKMQHEENKEEMDYQEKFFNEQIEKIRNNTEEKESTFEKLLQAEQ